MEMEENDDMRADVMPISAMAKTLLEVEEFVLRGMYLVGGLCSMVTVPFEMAFR